MRRRLLLWISVEEMLHEIDEYLESRDDYIYRNIEDINDDQKYYRLPSVTSRELAAHALHNVAAILFSLDR